MAGLRDLKFWKLGVLCFEYLSFKVRILKHRLSESWKFGFLSLWLLRVLEVRSSLRFNALQCLKTGARRSTCWGLGPEADGRKLTYKVRQPRIQEKLNQAWDTSDPGDQLRYFLCGQAFRSGDLLAEGDRARNNLYR